MRTSEERDRNIGHVPEERPATWGERHGATVIALVLFAMAAVAITVTLIFE